MTEKETTQSDTNNRESGSSVGRQMAWATLGMIATFAILVGIVQPGLLTGRSAGGDQPMGCGGEMPSATQSTKATLGKKKQDLLYPCNPPCEGSQVCVESTTSKDGTKTYTCDDDGCVPDCGANETCKTVTLDSPSGSKPVKACVPCNQTICTDMGYKVCVDTNADMRHCGACNTFSSRPSINYYCKNGQDTLCRDSLCQVKTIKEVSGNLEVVTSYQCVDRLTNPEHCGVCNNKCNEGKSCHLGRCVDTCGGTFCGTQCVSLQSDRDNCGACGNKCASNQICDGGQCTTCANTICGNECVDLQASPDHCGACSNACGEGSTCSNGSCQPACSQSACNNACVNTGTDPEHCGGCGIKCIAGQVCKGGNCIGEHVVLPICEEFQNAIKVAHIAYDNNSNKANKLATLPQGNFKLVKTYHADTSNFTHAYISRATYNNKYLCYVAFRGTRSQPQDQIYYLHRLLTGLGGPWQHCNTTEGQTFARCWLHLYDCYQGARGTNLIDNTISSSDNFKSHDKTLLPDHTRLVRDVMSLVENGHCNGGIRIVGHSVGGAVASLHAAELYTRNRNIFTKSFMKVITFGEPRVMDKYTADFYHTRITKYRITNKNDVVPSFPNTVWGYYHWGATKKIKEGGSQIVDEKQNWSRTWRMNTEAHSKDTYLRRLGHCDCSDSGSGSGCQSATNENTCQSGTTLCGTTCYNLKVDEENCGSCGNKCSVGKVCINGTCTCDTGQTACSGVCQDLQNDPANCGACGNQCASGKQCCGGQCVDLTQNASNCGVCGNACSTGQTCCNGKCNDFLNDENNCGTCGNKCGNSQTCCNGACKDVSSDSNNCGTCGKTCGSGKTCCNHLCVDTKTTIKHCGTCGFTCQEGVDCGASQCKCPSGTIACNGKCATSQNDPNHCGGCGISCATGTCNSGVCSCPAGTYKDTDGSCKACAAGSYQDQAGQTSCKVCPTGHYQDQTGQTSCKACPAGTKNPNTGSTSASACITCPKGTYQNLTGAHWCKSCVKGTYNPNTGSTSASACLPCPAGQYNGGYAKASCKACAAGSYQDQTGQTSCKACAAGSYQDQTGQTSCKACPAGTKNPDTGSTSVSACITCPKGTYQNLTGADWCKSCLKGTYNPNKGSTSASACLPCPAGQYNDGYAKASCKACAAGTYTDQTGQKSCNACSFGTFQSLTGQTSCITCRDGKTTCSTGSTSSSACVSACTQ